MATQGTSYDEDAAQIAAEQMVRLFEQHGREPITTETNSAAIYDTLVWNEVTSASSAGYAFGHFDISEAGGFREALLLSKSNVPTKAKGASVLLRFFLDRYVFNNIFDLYLSYPKLLRLAIVAIDLTAKHTPKKTKFFKNKFYFFPTTDLRDNLRNSVAKIIQRFHGDILKAKRAGFEAGYRCANGESTDGEISSDASKWLGLTTKPFDEQKLVFTPEFLTKKDAMDNTPTKAAYKLAFKCALLLDCRCANKGTNKWTFRSSVFSRQLDSNQVIVFDLGKLLAGKKTGVLTAKYEKPSFDKATVAGTGILSVFDDEYSALMAADTRRDDIDERNVKRARMA